MESLQIVKMASKLLFKRDRTHFETWMTWNTNFSTHTDTHMQSPSVKDTKLQPNNSTNLLFINQFYYREEEEEKKKSFNFVSQTCTTLIERVKQNHHNGMCRKMITEEELYYSMYALRKGKQMNVTSRFTSWLDMMYDHHHHRHNKNLNKRDIRTGISIWKHSISKKWKCLKKRKKKAIKP